MDAARGGGAFYGCSCRASAYADHRTMSAFIRITAVSLCLAAFACTQSPQPSAGEANAGIDSLNARLVRAYRTHDPQAYAALYTDSAVFEWPAFNTVRGPAGLAAMAQSNWASLKDMDLRLTIANRRFAPDHATEFGAFEQSWRDSSGGRMTEFGRYVSLLVRQKDGSWRMDRFFGFEDSTRSSTSPPSR
jgi:ketosteroid isomerase-like protein